MATHSVTTTWKRKMQFESTNPSGETLLINAGAENGGEGAGLRPKAMMLASLAGCSGLDIASLIEKMKLDVEDFKIETSANLTEEDPKIYDSVIVEYHFYGNNLNETKLQRAVDLSVDKYCGVMEMFRKFATIETKTFFHKI
jgi:putative redox protein